MLLLYHLYKAAGTIRAHWAHREGEVKDTRALPECFRKRGIQRKRIGFWNIEATKRYKSTQ